MLLRLWFVISVSALMMVVLRPSVCRADEAPAAFELPAASEAAGQAPAPAAEVAPADEPVPVGEPVPALEAAPTPASEASSTPSAGLTPSPQAAILALTAVVDATPPASTSAPVPSAPTVVLAAPATKPKAKRSPGIRALRWGGVAIAALGINVAVGSYSAYVNGAQDHERYTTLRAVNDAGWVLVGVGSVMHVVSWFCSRSEPRASTPPQAVQHSQSPLSSRRY